jgi:hypothetical protein
MSTGSKAALVLDGLSDFILALGGVDAEVRTLPGAGGSGMLG